MVPLNPPVSSEDILEIRFRGAELKLPARMDIDVVAAMLRAIQSL